MSGIHELGRQVAAPLLRGHAPSNATTSPVHRQEGILHTIYRSSALAAVTRALRANKWSDLRLPYAAPGGGELKAQWLAHIQAYRDLRAALEADNEFAQLNDLHGHIDWIWTMLARNRALPWKDFELQASLSIPAGNLNDLDSAYAERETNQAFKWLQIAALFTHRVGVTSGTWLSDQEQLEQRLEEAKLAPPGPRWAELTGPDGPTRMKVAEHRMLQRFRKRVNPQRLRQIETLEKLDDGSYWSSSYLYRASADRSRRVLAIFHERRVHDMRALIDPQTGHLNPTNADGQRLIDLLEDEHQADRLPLAEYVKLLEALKHDPVDAYEAFWHRANIRIQDYGLPEQTAHLAAQHDKPSFWLWWTSEHWAIAHAEPLSPSDDARARPSSPPSSHPWKTP